MQPLQHARVRAEKCASGVHSRGRARVYCNNRRKPWPRQGKITLSDEAASGETIGFYYLRARYMNPSSGRFTQQDSFAGFDSDPVTLHKYLYAGAGPVNGRDPSGHMTLAELNTTMGQLTQMSFRVLNYLDKASTVLGVLQTVWQIYNIMENPAIAAQAEQVLNSGDPDFQNLIRNRMSDALSNFRRNSAKIVAKTVQLHGADIINTATQGAAGRDRGFLIFLPTPVGISNSMRIDVPLGYISVKGKSIKIKGRVGGAASHLGRVIEPVAILSPRTISSISGWTTTACMAIMDRMVRIIGQIQISTTMFDRG